MSEASAATVGSAPTYDVGKQPKKPRRVEVTKNAAWRVGVKTAMAKIAGEEQTRGEFEAATSASGQGASQFTGMVDRTERRAGNQGSRGVPEWLRLLKDLPGQTPNTLSGTGRTGA